jgi:O-acetylhomoserine/O-acetylserine sulfhydrylase-like pyridoxal-dependent enzyme
VDLVSDSSRPTGSEFLKEHRRVASLQAAQAEEKRNFESALAQQLKQIQALMTTVKEQAAQLPKVSNQLELIKAAHRVAANDQ